MNEEAQRIAIAEACGWKKGGPGTNAPWTRGPLDDLPDVIYTLPDYLHDLNACHEMEKMLTLDQKEKYQVGLANLVAHSPFETYGHWSDVGSVFTIHATAAQRTEAFLRTIGKWEE